MFQPIFDSYRLAFVYIPYMAAHVFSGGGLVMFGFKFPATGSLPVILSSLSPPSRHLGTPNSSSLLASLDATLCAMCAIQYYPDQWLYYIWRKHAVFARPASTFVITEQQGAVFSIQINRPDVRNAINNETERQLRKAFRHFEKNVNSDNSRIAVLSGSSGTFCAGYDLREVSTLDVKDSEQVFMAREGLMVSLIEV